MISNSFHIPLELTVPGVRTVASGLGIPDSVEPDKPTLECIDMAIKRYEDFARAQGLVKNISTAEFADIFRGENLNEDEAPLETIYENSDRLALFVVTVGQDICEMISRLFEDNDYAIASVLDAVASAAVELAEKQLVEEYLNSAGRTLEPSQSVVPFSPGYCGWNITAQRKLFQYLNPEQIGISINESCLMNPLKSISGVLVISSKKHLEMYPDYPFCKDCKSQSCIERTSQLLRS